MSEKISVLVVEDDDHLRFDMVDALEEAGLVVFDARNADTAIELLTNNPDIRLIVTDVDMPGSMDGLALARFVRDKWPPIHIIVVSAAAITAEDLPRNCAIYRKPVPREDVERKILELVG